MNELSHEIRINIIATAKRSDLQHSTKSFFSIINEVIKRMRYSGKAVKNLFIKHPQLTLKEKFF